MSTERLVESLRLPQVPILHAQVFLFFRVLLLRMSPQHLTSLWPTMITELVSNTGYIKSDPCCSCACVLPKLMHSHICMLQVQVFLLMEQELTADEDISRYTMSCYNKLVCDGKCTSQTTHSCLPVFLFFKQNRVHL